MRPGWTPDLEAQLDETEQIRLASLRRHAALGPTDTNDLLLTIAKLRTDLKYAQHVAGVLQRACESLVVSCVQLPRSNVSGCVNTDANALDVISLALAKAKAGAP